MIPKMQKSDVLTWEKKVYKPQINIQVRHLICIMPADLALSKNLFFFYIKQEFILFYIFFNILSTSRIHSVLSYHLVSK